MTKPKLISIVIPAYKEAGNVCRYMAELVPVLEDLPYPYELIIVEDGSKDKKPNDKTWDEMVALYNQLPTKISILRHMRNYGMTGALQTGIDVAHGDYVLFFSADFEIAPREIHKVVAKLDEGYDFVNTKREKRWKETFIDKYIRQIPSGIANGLIRYTLGPNMADNGSGLKGFKRSLINNVRMYGEMQRIIATYTGTFTKNYIELPVEYIERKAGTSAYGGFKGMVRRTFAVMLDLLGLKFMTTFSIAPFTLMPGRAFGFTGIVTFLTGALISGYLLYVKLVFGQSIGTRPLFTIGLIFVVMGVQMIMTGMLGELLLRIYYESGKTKNFIVAEEYLAQNYNQPTEAK